MPPQIPWPGPIPYEEKQKDVFFGRERDVDRFLGLMDVEPLLVVTGPSGCGKTSLLRAALIPALRYRRHLALKSGRSFDAYPPVILVREWSLGFVPTSSTEGAAMAAKHDALLHALMAGFEALADGDKLAQDAFQDLGGARFTGGWGDALSFVKGLAESGQGLILVLDQFEEIVRIPRYSEGVVEFVAEALRRVSGLKVVLSLRAEDFLGLRLLETRYHHGLGKSTYYVEPLNREAATRAVLDAARHASVDVNEAVIETLLGELAPLPNPMDFTPDPAEPGSVDLLQLQTLLVSLCGFVLDKQPATSHIRLDEGVIEDYRDNLFRTLGEESGRGLLGQLALLHHIDSTFAQVDTGPFSAGIGEEGTLSADQAAAIVRRIAERFIPFLSVGGYKTRVRPSELVDLALQSEIAELRRLGRDNNRAAQKQFLAGPARRFNWKIATVKTALEWLGNTAVQHLVKRSILKLWGIGEGGMLVELAHDQYSRPLQRWVERRRDTAHQLELTLTAVESGRARVGEGLPGPREVRSMHEYLVWRAGSISGVEFRDCVVKLCEFSSSTFDGCTFENTTFEQCRLRGVRFKDCKFRGVRFNEVDLAGSYFDGSDRTSRTELQDVSFTESLLDASGFYRIRLGGRCIVRECSVNAVLLEAIEPAEKGARLVFERCDVQFTEVRDNLGANGAGIVIFDDCHETLSRLGKKGEAISEHDEPLWLSADARNRLENLFGTADADA